MKYRAITPIFSGFLTLLVFRNAKFKNKHGITNRYFLDPDILLYSSSYDKISSAICLKFI